MAWAIHTSMMHSCMMHRSDSLPFAILHPSVRHFPYFQRLRRPSWRKQVPCLLTNLRTPFIWACHCYQDNLLEQGALACCCCRVMIFLCIYRPVAVYSSSIAYLSSGCASCPFTSVSDLLGLLILPPRGAGTYWLGTRGWKVKKGAPPLDVCSAFIWEQKEARSSGNACTVSFCSCDGKWRHIIEMSSQICHTTWKQWSLYM